MINGIEGAGLYLIIPAILFIAIYVIVYLYYAFKWGKP